MARDFELIDVCHSVEDGMVTYKGLPSPVITDHLTREASRRFTRRERSFTSGRSRWSRTPARISTLRFIVTHGEGSRRTRLYSVANLDGWLSGAARRRSGADVFSGFEVKDKAVLVHTGWDRHWRTEEYSSGNHPFLTADAATELAKNGATLVGIDSYNIDTSTAGTGRSTFNPARPRRPDRRAPLRPRRVAAKDFKFFAVPVKVKRFGTFPVRAFGLVTL